MIYNERFHDFTVPYNSKEKIYLWIEEDSDEEGIVLRYVLSSWEPQRRTSFMRLNGDKFAVLHPQDGNIWNDLTEEASAFDRKIRDDVKKELDRYMLKKLEEQVFNEE
jgi:hypothetical protein